MLTKPPYFLKTIHKPRRKPTRQIIKARLTEWVHGFRRGAWRDPRPEETPTTERVAQIRMPHYDGFNAGLRTGARQSDLELA